MRLQLQAMKKTLKEHADEKERLRRRHRYELRRVHGLSGRLLTSDEYHRGILYEHVCVHAQTLLALSVIYVLYVFADNTMDAQHYFGFPSWVEAKKYIECFWPGIKLVCSDADSCTRTSFEQCLIAKMFLKTALEQIDLARIWGISQQFVSKILLKWCPRWGERVCLHVRLQSLPLQFIKASQPAGFAERYHTMPSTEVDGKDVRCEQIRKDNLGKRLTRSNKYKSAALRLVL